MGLRPQVAASGPEGTEGPWSGPRAGQTCQGVAGIANPDGPRAAAVGRQAWAPGSALLAGMYRVASHVYDSDALPALRRRVMHVLYRGSRFAEVRLFMHLCCPARGATHGMLPWPRAGMQRSSSGRNGAKPTFGESGRVLAGMGRWRASRGSSSKSGLPPTSRRAARQPEVPGGMELKPASCSAKLCSRRTCSGSAVTAAS
jgi:hypothetical protein